MNDKLGFLGAGQMGSALAAGAVKSNLIKPADLCFCDPNAGQLQKMKSMFPGCETTSDASTLLSSATRIILAVKPQVLPSIAEQLRSMVTENHTLISIAAGITLSKLKSWFSNAKLIRVMPNTPAQVMAGASAIASELPSDSPELNAAAKLFETVGKVVHISENQMDAVTGLSGSGPAYVLLFIEALIDAGVANGLPRAIATTLAVQTVLGTSQMVERSKEHPAVLKDQVTSPGGTTIAGLRILEREGVRSAVIEAVTRATERSRELG
jgi:pyrroline-5-carboxylate reductase